MAPAKIPEDSKLLQPIKVGHAQLQHRMAMAPLTRYRHDHEHVPLPFVKQYYGERASTAGTLVISEATGTSPEEVGHNHSPSFVTDAQVAGWKEVIAAVHEQGSFWFQQIWAKGRASDPNYQKQHGFKYRSSSAVPLKDDAPAPEAMTELEILKVIDDFVATAKRVVAAGGDGVEIHSAHGYLLDQFVSDAVNKRTDRWGGSVENRARLTIEVVKAVAAAVGPERVGIRLSPYASFQGAGSSNIEEQFGYIVRELKKVGSLAYLSLVEPRGDPAKLLDPDNGSGEDEPTLDFILEAWDNQSPVIVAGAYSADSADMATRKHYAKWDVIVAFGRNFLANPDFVWRVKNGVELNQYHRGSFYIKASNIGYNDYPFSAEYVNERREWGMANLDVARS